MDKSEYIAKALSLQRKKWENLIVSRIIHRINDYDIEFVCQQYVRLANGGRALTDIFFPQFKVHLEIDEPHHVVADASFRDQIRMQDIVDATKHEIERISIYSEFGSSQFALRPIRDIFNDADRFADRIIADRDELKREGRFRAWDFEGRYRSKRYLERGYLDVEDGPAFQTQMDALQCFGYKGGHYQRATWAVPDGSGRTVWFPKLYENIDWRNSLSNDGLKIVMEPITDVAKKRSGKKLLNPIAFGHSKDALGNTLYRFVGCFELNLIETKDDYIVFSRLATRVATQSI